MTLRAQLNELIHNKHLLTHPFYVAWTEGKLTQDQLRQYAVQYFQNVLAFPTYVSGVHFNTPHFGGSIAVRQEILENLVSEEQGPRNHPALWQTFATALGATDRELTETAPLPTTENLVNTFRRLCIESPFYAGLAALYVYESQIPEIAATKISGLQQFYGMQDPAAYEFFTVHQTADVWHADAEMQLIEQHADSPEKQAEVLQVAGQAADALWQFLDGVYEQYCQDLKAPDRETLPV
ncbi:pyrroloquinoline quinone biosynthesis protein PqqC [Leptolyngbya sp. 'hensonii']|uniref:CADD family putative folate metabolism protein n=1 Tax=Leptolyngbya sp. 'hensonii' TaxID=1922337 RepID=UPI00094FAB63|nr:CADD family putative folate metabolism protein [Leptolyngbya sp. 'hensonii']OLP20122.1 pyrroloquinoline quinone biosynthesis protein PqqC [Leptolyngbya sp. 'hensonii']